MLLKIVIALNSSGVAEITCYEGLTILIESSYTWSFLLKVLIHEKDPFEGSYTWRFLWKVMKVLIHEGLYENPYKGSYTWSFFYEDPYKGSYKKSLYMEVLITWKKRALWRFMKVFMKVMVLMIKLYIKGPYTWKILIQEAPYTWRFLLKVLIHEY